MRPVFLWLLAALALAGAANDALAQSRLPLVIGGNGEPRATRSGEWIDPAPVGTAWTSYTPVVTAGSGAFTSVTPTGRWQQVGKRVDYRIDIIITTNGTAAGQVYATLPLPIREPTPIFGREVNVTAQPLIGNAAGSNVQIVYFDFSYPGGDGRRLVLSGSYETP